MTTKETPPVCDYEGSDYQQRFWESGGRQYEDLCEAIALRRLLPGGGGIMLELGAGAGRNTPRYQGYKKVVLLDYSVSQLKQAQERLQDPEHYLFVAADIYKLPFRDALFDSATMIRTLHHMADPHAALHQVRSTLRPGAVFILEFANKRNIKAILRYLLHLQHWNPFSLEQVEYAPLNFDFHPRTIREVCRRERFHLEKTLTVSHFRLGFLKRNLPARFLAALDAVMQWTGSLWQLSPSVFLRLKAVGGEPASMPRTPADFFKCPECGSHPLVAQENALACQQCKRIWRQVDGIYVFRSEGSA